MSFYYHCNYFYDSWQTWLVTSSSLTQSLAPAFFYTRYLARSCAVVCNHNSFLFFLFDLSGLLTKMSLCDFSHPQFQRHIKKSEGLKIPKVELQISIYGVKILDPKTKVSDIVWQVLWRRARRVKLYCQHRTPLRRTGFVVNNHKVGE